MAYAQHAEMLTKLQLLQAAPLTELSCYCLILIDGLWLRWRLQRIRLGCSIQIDTARRARDTYFAHGTRASLTRQCDRLRFGEGAQCVGVALTLT